METIPDDLESVLVNLEDNQAKYKDDLARIKKLLGQISRELEPEEDLVDQITPRPIKTSWWDVLKYPAMSAAAFVIGWYMKPFGIDVRLDIDEPRRDSDVHKEEK